MAEFTDEQLIEMLCSPENGIADQAWICLRRKGYAGIRRHILANSGTEADAEEIFFIAQEILLKKIVNGEFKRPGNPCGFLFITAKNQWLKELKRRKKFAQGYPDEQMESLPNPGLGVAEEMEQSEFLNWFQEQFEKLDPVCQRALIHRYYEGRSMKQIAELLGYTNEGTARNKRYECVKKLRILMEKHPPPDGIFLPKPD